jgi:hypothetical protein
MAVSCTNKTDCHDITQILLKVALNTLTRKLSFELKSNGTHSEVVNKPQYPMIAADAL